MILLTATSRSAAFGRRFRRWALSVLPFLLLLAGALRAGAALQFDVFLGYDGAVREAAWFPVACEVFNDGPGFNAVFELTASGSYGADQTRRVFLELPTNTRKRFVIPVFSSSGLYGAWDARLLDDHGHVRAEHLALRPRVAVTGNSPILGALSRSYSGLPVLPDAKARQGPTQPLVVRLQPELFPDNPIALQGLNALYLDSNRALDLKVMQVAALLAWVQAGGHLVVGVEQPTDINATPWLRDLLPCELTGLDSVEPGEGLQNWLQTAYAGEGEEGNLTPAAADRARGRMAQRSFGRSPPLSQRAGPAVNPFSTLADDGSFDTSKLPIATGENRGGRVLFSADGKPLAIAADRGRGQVTALLFSPEREPFHSWKNLPWFWAKIAGMPAGLFSGQQPGYYGGMSLDGVFGEMIDSRQIRKLPVTWLLLLLVVYLAVIGPVDQYCLRRLGRQMLTWVTFPLYVVLFSGLIYLLGFALRAGQTEWNELHLVDVLPQGRKAELRGFTYASVYSPANARFQLASDEPFATLRGEFQGYRRGESSRANVDHRGNGYEAEIYVPVWTSQLYVSDWWQIANTPLRARVVEQDNHLRVTVENHLTQPLTRAHLVVGDRIYDLGALAPGKTNAFALERTQGMLLRDFVQQEGGQFQVAVQQRQNAFGSARLSRTWDIPLCAMAASFISQLGAPVGQPGMWGRFYSRFTAPAGVDLSPVVRRGDAVLLAWDAGRSLVHPINRFTPRRLHRDTLLRLAVPVAKTGS
jgi:hypothetical protein